MVSSRTRPRPDLRLDQRRRAALVAEHDLPSGRVGQRREQHVLEEPRRRQPVAVGRERRQQRVAAIDRRQALGRAEVDRLALGVRAGQRGGAPLEAERLRQDRLGGLVPAVGVDAIADRDEEAAARLDVVDQRGGDGRGRAVHVGQEDGAEGREVAAGEIVGQRARDREAAAARPQRRLEEEGLVLGADRARIAVDDQHAQAARGLDQAGAPIVEREGVLVDRHLGLVRAAAGGGEDEPLAGAPGRRDVDEAARHLGAVERQRDAQVAHRARARSWRSRRPPRSPAPPPRAPARRRARAPRGWSRRRRRWRRAGRSRGRPRRAAGVTSSQPAACRSVTT